MPAIIVAGSLVVFGLIIRGGQRGEEVETPRPVVAAYDMEMIPVPVQPVPAGTRLRDVRFRSESFPRHQIPEGALRSIASYHDAVAIAGLPANLPVFAENVSLTADAHNPVIERIPPGMRAMTVKVDATSSVEGWAGSGAIVDVLLVGKERTTVIAQKVKILSAERSTSPVEGQASPSVPSTVTLLVTQEQCLAINTATPNGKIAFALRSGRDESDWENPVFVAERLRGGAASGGEETVTGFASVKEGERGESFALADGRWVKTEVVPEGFFPSRR